MFLYLVVAVFGLFFAVIHSMSNKNYIYQRCIEFAFLSTLIFISTFRWETGTDFYSYVFIFDAVPEIGSGDFESVYQNIELGFKYVTSIVKYFGGLNLYFFTFSILSLLPMWIGLIRLNRIIEFNILVALLIYLLIFFLPYNLNAVRQSVAMGLFVFSLPFIIERKALPAVLFSILASLFHSTGLLIALSYFFVRYFPIRNYYYFLLLLVVSVGLLFSNLLVTIFSSFGVDISRWLELWDSIDAISIFIRLIVLMLLVFPKPMNLRNNTEMILFNIYFYGVFLYISLGSVGMMATRFNMFFRILEIVIIPYLFKGSRFLTNKFFLLIVFLIYAFSAYYMIVSNPDYSLNLKF